MTCTACGEVPTAAPSPVPASSSPASPTPTVSASALESAAPTPSASSPGSSSGDTPAEPTPTETTAPTTAPTKAISTYADDLALAGDRLTYTRLRWYWGPAAQARCKAKKIKAKFEWCNDYYYENTRKKGSGTMARDAEIRILDDDGQPVTASTTELAAALRQDSWPHWRVWLAGTEVVRLEQIFTP